jgi:acyl carrier protein
MQLKERVEKAIHEAVEELNQQLPPVKRLKTSLETRLLDGRGSLDSLGVVNLIVAAEKSIEKEFGSSVSLTDLVAGDDPSGLRTVGSLCDYVAGLLEGHGSAPGDT